jgi:hypothetical protein
MAEEKKTREFFDEDLELIQTGRRGSAVAHKLR